MSYKYYSFSVVAGFIALAVVSAAITLCFVYDVTLLVTLLLVALLCSILIGLWRLVCYPMNAVAHFLLAIRCGERMLRFPRTKDRRLNSMHEQMNHITALYSKNMHDIESKKNYYDKILRIMTHEIRNTITPIISLSDFYLNSNDEQQSVCDIKEGIQIINAQSKSIKEFLDSYHTLVHISAPVKKHIPLQKLFREIIALMSKEPQGERIKAKCADIDLFADITQMRLLLVNLLRNSLFAISDFADGAIELCASMNGKQVVITITDNGCGIQPKQIEEIFLPFYTTRKQGTGIGLSLCRQIMLLHEGDIFAESNPQSRHTMFTLVFPETEKE